MRRTTPRDLGTFWEWVDTIAASTDGSARAIDAELRRRLASMTPARIKAHYRRFTASVWALYRWDVWQAADIVMGAPPQQLFDDGFLYFRHWLVFQGRALFDAVLRDPDSGLADFLTCTGLDRIARAERCEWFEAEEVEYAFLDAYEAKTGSRLRVAFVPPRQPRGKHVARRFNRLRSAMQRRR